MRRVRLAVAAIAVAATVALVGASCAEPVVPIAASALPNALVTATPTPLPPLPTPTVTPIPIPTPEPGEQPTPVPLQPGIDENTIRIAVIADGETGGSVDNLFRDAWAGMEAWALAVNDAGGLGDRIVELVKFNTSLFSHDSVLEAACRGEFFAIVGGQSLADYDGAEILGTEDCNIVDMPGAVHGARRAISPVTYVPNPILNDRRQAGPVRWLAEQFPETVGEVALFFFDELQLRSETARIREVLTAEGIVTVSIATNLEEGPSERVLARYEEFASQAIVWNADPDRLVALLRELKAKDLAPEWVLCELACYSRSFLAAGDAVEGVYAWVPHSPVESPISDQEFITYRWWLTQVPDGGEWSQVGIQAWMAGRLFEDAFNRVLQVEPEAPTRESVIRAVQGIHDFTARGMTPLIDVGGRQPTPCFALVTVRDGNWVQAHPQPPRDLDCATENLFELIATSTLGLEETIATSAATSELQTDPAEDAAEELQDLDNPDELDEELGE